MTKLFFKTRKPEPKIMEELEMKTFERMSIDNFKNWIIPFVDIVKKKKLPKHAKILDLACGPGILSKTLAVEKKVWDIYGIDSSVEAIKLAKKNSKDLKNTTFFLRDAVNTNFSDNWFDLIICKDSLHHFYKPEKILKELIRILKPKGLLLVIDLKRNIPYRLLKRAIPPNTTVKKLQYYSARAAYTIPEVKKMLRSIKPTNIKITEPTTDLWSSNFFKKNKIEIEKLKTSLETRFLAEIKK
jgi:ubiquinone/menaquinone biosynthesis C-methylase UbiE